MSVLNQSGEEQVECPLCMEPLEVDDLNFYPCTCGYQICRFCWHRIRTDENGLCPACRKAYSENPADFTPLSKEQVAQLKAEKRQRDQQRKAKLSESRKHLASVRVVQRNLVFVVGLPMRLADPEVLKKHEYFGKFGKIHKVVINQSTAYAGTQGPSASAYVTYMKSDDALRAIQSVNNSTLDGKTIKTSLGTTKYCSHFMKNQSCPKPDCMYLHDFGDQEASFTKEQMHAGKHQEYEKKLHDCLLAKLAAAQQAAAAAQIAAVAAAAAAVAVSSSEAAAATTTTTKSGGKHTAKHTNGDQNKDKEKEKDAERHSASTNGKENGSWPQLDKDKDKPEVNNKKTSEAKENGNVKEKPEKSKRSKKNVNVSENNSKNKNRNSAIGNGIAAAVDDSSVNNKEKEKERVKDKERDVKDKDSEREKEKDEKPNRQTATQLPSSPPTTPSQDKDTRDKIPEKEDRKRPNSVAMECTNNNTIKSENDFTEKHPPQTQHAPDYKMQLHNDNSSFFTSNSFSCAKQLPEASDHDAEHIQEHEDDEDDSSSLLSRQINGQEHPLLDGDAWDFDFGYPNHSHHLEELATRQPRQRVEAPKDPLAESFANAFGGCGLDRFTKFDALMDSPYIPSNTESLLETLAKNSVNYQMHPTSIATTQHQQQQQQQQQQQSLRQQQQQHYMNGHKDALLSGLGLLDQQHASQGAANGYPKILDVYRSMYAPLQQQQQQPPPPPQGLMNGLHAQTNGFHSYAQQQQLNQMNHFNHMSMPLEKRMALQQQLQQRHIEENFLSMSLGKQMQHPQQQQQQPPPHGYAQMNGGSHQFDAFATSMANSFGLAAGGGHSAVGVGGGSATKPNRHVVDENKDLDYRFQEAQKALEALVESDNHVHNSGRTTLGTNQLNGLVHSQSGNHMPPPPPGFVQNNTHMNSFGSKILPFLNMNGQQQQQQINTTQQNNWPTNFSQIQQQQQQQSQHNKGMGGVCNDWKVLDTAIISASSRRHIPSMGPLLDQQYAQPGTQPGGGSVGAALQQQQQQQAAAAAAAAAQQQRTYDMYATFSNYSNPLPTAAVYASAGYQTHLPTAAAGVTQPNLNWLGSELTGPISTPPGFRSAGQATKQQEC